MNDKIRRIINTLEASTGYKVFYEKDFDSKNDKFRFDDMDGNLIKLIKIPANKIDDADENDLEKIIQNIINSKHNL